MAWFRAISAVTLLGCGWFDTSVRVATLRGNDRPA